MFIGHFGNTNVGDTSKFFVEFETRELASYTQEYKPLQKWKQLVTNEHI